MKKFFKSIYAGILIGIGDLVYLSLDNKILAAILFSIGLLTIIHQQLLLYTGKIGYFTDGQYYLRDYLSMFLGNFSGILFTVAIGVLAKPELLELIYAFHEKKFMHTWYELFILGILCGMCMYIAVSNKNDIITIFAITIFILCGFEHCIADIPYLMISPTLIDIIKYLFIVLGNSLGAIFLHQLNKDEVLT